jgi:hypothetical protein
VAQLIPAGAGERYFHVPAALTQVCPSLQKNVRTFLPSCLVSQITLALESSSAAGSPCNLAGGATAPVDETKATIANSPAATKAARLAHAGISVPPHLKPGGNFLRRPYRAAGFVPAIDVLLLGAQHKDARVRHKRLFQNRRPRAESGCRA